MDLSKEDPSPAYICTNAIMIVVPGHIRVRTVLAHEGVGILSS